MVIAQKGYNSTPGRPSTEYHLSLDMAKHVAMMSQTDKGHSARNLHKCKHLATCWRPTILPGEEETPSLEGLRRRVAHPSR